MSELPPPTVVDVVEACVRQLNDLVIYALISNTLLTPGQAEFVKEADWRINSVHDALTGYWDEGSDDD